MKLNYNEELVALIHFYEEDFPSYLRKYEIVTNNKEILNYAQHSIQYTNAIMNSNEEELNKIIIDEEVYLKIIKCNDWSIIDENNQTRHILSPAFQKQEIVWRDNLII